MTRAKTHADVRRGDGPVAPGKGRSAAPGDAPRDDAPPRCAASDGRQRAGVAAPRVGAAYQVPAASLPDPRHGPARPRSSRASPVRVWDATRARAATRAVDLLERIVPRERRERALALLHRHDYEITDEVLRQSMEEPPRGGTSWSPAAQDAFARSLATKRRRKDFAAAAQGTGRTAGECQTYYYSLFKSTAEYKDAKRSAGRRMETRSRSLGESART